MNQKFKEFYRLAVTKARKSEKALKQIQRKTYAEMLRCKAKPYDQLKECIKTNRSLFELEPMRYMQSFASNQSIQTDKAFNGVASLKSLPGSSWTSTNRGKPALFKHNAKNKKNLNWHLSHAKCTPNKLLKNDNCDMEKETDHEHRKRITLSKAVIDHTLNEGILDEMPRQSFSKSSSACIPYQQDNCHLINKIFAEDFRKRKREDILSYNAKMTSNRAVKEVKLDSTDCYKSIFTSQIPRTVSSIPVSQKIRKEGFTLSSKLDMMTKGIPSKSYDNCKVSRNTITIYNRSNKFQTPKPSLIPVYQPKSQCKWIECKVNHPIKQSKSKIPLLIHQLGSKNESNLVAHLKRIGAYKK